MIVVIIEVRFIQQSAQIEQDIPVGQRHFMEQRVGLVPIPHRRDLLEERGGDQSIVDERNRRQQQLRELRRILQRSDEFIVALRMARRLHPHILHPLFLHFVLDRAARLAENPVALQRIHGHHSLHDGRHHLRNVRIAAHLRAPREQVSHLSGLLRRLRTPLHIEADHSEPIDALGDVLHEGVVELAGQRAVLRRQATHLREGLQRQQQTLR